MALALPVLEPFTPAKISQLSLITLSCLYCAVSTTIAYSIINMSGSTLPKTQVMILSKFLTLYQYYIINILLI